ncbi:MAG TPA: response regulator transcription factor [Chloroflexota bacterium]|nr:response regulator transcription factor [Chloroflexota bacterium]
MNTPGQTRKTILVVDDDERIRKIVSDVLLRCGFAVLQAADGDVVLGLVRRHQPDLVIMDVKMERVSGLHALTELRAESSDVAVIVMTGSGEEQQVLDAFAAGADDYVTKPVSQAQLVARVKAVLRRLNGGETRDPIVPPEPTVTTYGPLCLNAARHTLTLNDRVVNLTPTETLLLDVLMRSPGHIFAPEDLLERVWGAEYRDAVDVLRTNIYRLRKKLQEEIGLARWIQSRPSAGYFFEADS